MKKYSRVADHTTWCGNDVLAGVKLADILNGIRDTELIRQVNVIIGRYDRRIKAISTIKTDNSVSIGYFYNLLFDDTKKKVKENKFPYLVETHLLNILNAKHKGAKKLINKK